MTELGLNFPTAWSRRFPATALRDFILTLIATPLTRRLTTMDIRGGENLPPLGTTTIYTANHTSHLDTIIALSALNRSRRRRTVVAAASDTFFMKLSTARITVLLVNAIPIERHKVNRQSAAQAIEILNQGWDLLIYPEGGRTPTGPMLEFKGGAAYLAERSNAVVVPTFMIGAGEWLSHYAKAPIYLEMAKKWRSPVTVAFGPPLAIEEGENIRRFGQRIQDAVIDLARETTSDSSWGSHLRA
ncbi:MAG: lysophospholipid acyltransferase family protein [Actinomycetes bacterium]